MRKEDSSRRIKWFQVLVNGRTVRELSEKEYLKRVDRTGYHVGWIDGQVLYLVRPTVLSKFVLFDIEKLGGWAI